MSSASDCKASLVRNFGVLTPRRIHKDLFFAQIEMVWNEGRLLFEESFEGWPDGPVVRSAWGLQQKSGNPNKVDILEEAILARVHKRHAGLTDEELCEESHNHPLWIASRQELAPHQKGNREIPGRWFLDHYQRIAMRGRVEIDDGKLIIWKANESRFASLRALEQLAQLRSMGMMKQLEAMGVNTDAEFRVMEATQ